MEGVYGIFTRFRKIIPVNYSVLKYRASEIKFRF